MARTKTKAQTADNVTTLIPEDGKAAAVPAVQVAQPPALAQPDPLFAIIERASRDPNVDIDKMERLLRMKMDIEARNAKAAYLAALAEMQPKLPVINKAGVISKNEKDAAGNRTGRQEKMAKYAKWEDVVEGITPVLAEHGFSLSFRVAQPTPDRVAISGVLGHREGHTEETTLSLPIDNSGAKNNVQGWGSSVSYGKRYTAFALLNISARGEDDDGNAAGAVERAKDWTDAAIQHLNTTKPDKVGLAKYAVDNAKAIAWLKKNAPKEFERYQQAYSNAAEAAGIKKEEPRRGKAKPEMGTGTSGQSANAAEAGGAPTVASGQPAAITDVQDQNAPIEFPEFSRATEFLDWSSKWMDEPERTPTQAKQWEERFRDKIAEYGKSDIKRIKDGMVDLLAVYGQVLAK